MTNKNWMAAVAVTALTALLAIPAQAADEAGYKAACEAAEAARKAAADARYEWNTTAPLLEKADAAAAGGDYDKAAKLCNEARQQGELALAQSRREAEDWKSQVVK
ncbi:MAG: hypothetical protein WBM87_12490 [Woeseiaceae bacterium]